MPDQPVRVRCLACKGTKVEIVDFGMFSADPGPYSCAACKGTGTILATLADPEIAALIEVGRAYMGWYRHDSTDAAVALVAAREQADSVVFAPPPPEPRHD